MRADQRRGFLRGYGAGVLIGLFILIPLMNLLAGWWI